MNTYATAVIAAIFVSTFFAGVMALEEARAAVLFGLVALFSAPVAVHKVADSYWAAGLLFGLASFASFPASRALGITGLLPVVGVMFVYVAVLWGVGMGWKRSWR